MFCPKCGAEQAENNKFCFSCGCALSAIDQSQEKATAVQGQPKAFKKAVTVVLVIAVLVMGVIIFINTNSLENRLKSNIWWEELRFSNSKYDYSDSDWWQEDFPDLLPKGYYVNGHCDSILFCEYGTIRLESYQTPPNDGGAYTVSEEVTFENGLWRSFEWKVDYSTNDQSWELLDDNRLAIGNKTYTWSKTESDDTWYLSSTELRIGETTYTKEKPDFQVESGLPPYWCANCGREGPYSGDCPQCDSDETRTD